MNRLLIGQNTEQFLLQFLADDFSLGVTLIDPTGHVACDAATILPIGLTQRLLYFDPSDMGHPVGFNILQGVSGDKRHPLTENICAYFEAMWPNGWGAQSNYILANCLRILLDTPGSTLLGLLTLLTDNSYRAQCLLNCSDPVVLKNWQVINGWDAKQSQAAIAPLLNKVGTLLMSPVIRNIVGQPKSTTHGADIIIANLDRAKIGDLTAKLLGGLLIAHSSGEVYVNDFPFFAFDHFPFAQDRFTVSLRFLDEVDRRLQQDLLAIDDKVVLKTNPDDAKRLAFYLGMMNPRPLTELWPNVAHTPYAIIEAAPIKPLRQLKPIQKRTRAVHTRPRKNVEKAIEEAFG